MKNSNHASKALAVVLSGALAFAPAANAALDESNMAYTSAAEGFYGSLRVQYANNEKSNIDGGGGDNDSTVEAETSRLGVRGDIDLGGGLEAFYGFEWNLGGPANGDEGLNTRQHHVGLKGDWGSIWLGAFDSVIVRFGGFGTTDILDQYSGNFEPRYRTKNAIAYVSPDLNGFNFGIEVQANDGGNEDAKDATSDSPRVLASNEDDGNDFDSIGLGVGYSIQGLSFSGSYLQDQDALSITNLSNREETESDASQYALGIGYSQDNWTVAAMYGSREIAVGPYFDANGLTVDTGFAKGSSEEDAPFFSFAAGVSIDKLEVHGLWEQQSFEKAAGTEDVDNTIAAITARYHLGSKTRLRAGWKNTEWDFGEGDDFDDTNYALGLRVDF